MIQKQDILIKQNEENNLKINELIKLNNDKDNKIKELEQKIEEKDIKTQNLETKVIKIINDNKINTEELINNILNNGIVNTNKLKELESKLNKLSDLNINKINEIKKDIINKEEKEEEQDEKKEKIEDKKKDIINNDFVGNPEKLEFVEILTDNHSADGLLSNFDVFTGLKDKLEYIVYNNKLNFNLEIMTIRNKQIIKSLKGHKEKTTVIRYFKKNNNEDYILSCDINKKVIVWDIQNDFLKKIDFLKHIKGNFGFITFI